jgi:hypothetical protein
MAMGGAAACGQCFMSLEPISPGKIVVVDGIGLSEERKVDDT